MTLLSICQDAAARLGLETLASVVANSNETAQRLFRLANQSGLALMRRHDWTVLTREQTFVTVAAELQTDTPIPPDFDRFAGRTAFNRTARRRLAGPLSPEEWQVQKSLAATVVTDAFRLRGGRFLMLPAPPAGETIAYEYVSRSWVDADGDGAGDAAAFSADGERAVLDEEMITVDVTWRYRQTAGLNYAEAFRSAELTIADRIARDGGRRVVDYARRRPSGTPRMPSMPEGNFGGT